MSAWGSASTTAALEPGHEVEIELTQGTRVAGTVVQSDEQGVVLERAESEDRARIAATEIAEVLVVGADPPE
jgi:ribosome maturation factor RimP